MRVYIRNFGGQRIVMVLIMKMNVDLNKVIRRYMLVKRKKSYEYY